MKDWTGNKASARQAIGINKNYTTDTREINDYYATEPLAVELLCKVEKFSSRIWEPACGGGHVAKVLEQHGYQVKATDLVNRGYGDGGIDFLNQSEEWNGDIITNPPYKFATEFVQHSLFLVSEGHKVAMFCKLTFLEGIKRWFTLYRQKGLKVVYVAVKRLHCAKGGIFTTNIGEMMTYAWFVWQKGYTGEPVIRWINTPNEDKEFNLFEEVNDG